MLDAAVWKKASRSNGNGGNNCVETMLFMKASKSNPSGNCVEVGFAKAELSGAAGHCVEVGFHKADKSALQSNCVEVAQAQESGCTGDCMYPGAKPGDVLVRDSKQNGTENQPFIIYTEVEWKHLLHTLRMGYGAIFDGEATYVLHKENVILRYTPDEWAAFMDGVWKGEFDYPND